MPDSPFAAAFSDAFRRAVEFTLASEGGYTADPADRGNWTGGAVGQGELKGTNFGISAASYPSLDIKALTRDDAIAIYHRDYWNAVHGDALPFPIALVMFDTEVNGGAPVRWLQLSVPGVKVDGELGPLTIAAAHRAADPVGVALRILRRRLLFNAGLPSWKLYGPGWTQRAFDLCRAVCEAPRTV